MMIRKAPDMILGRELVKNDAGLRVPIYSVANGLIIAKAFADKILDLMN